ncbi:hypothetical protein V497_07456 [Pseudogymnoascus sp. VKM F-4516 (FW-969)]|nr:hypothetical protein V497_07456 [Pseudogymnoascus sp. VKM F-4516 (FW-969)]
MAGDRPHWDSRHPERGSPYRGRRGARGPFRGGRGRGSYHEDRYHGDRDEREREWRTTAAEHYLNSPPDRSQSWEYRGRDKDNGDSLSRDSSEHGFRQPLSQPYKSTPSTPTTPSGRGLGDEFASSIQLLTDWTTTKQLLQVKRERARQDYDEAKSIYEKGRPNHAQFPIEAERAKERYAKEKSALEALDGRLKDADANISTTKAVVAQHFDSVTSSRGGGRSVRSGADTEEGSSEAESRLVKELKAENRRLQTEVELRLKGTEERIRNDSRDQVVATNSALASMRGDILDLKNNTGYNKNQLVQQQDQLREHKAAIKKITGGPVNGHSNDASPPEDERSLLRLQSVETQLAADHSSNLKLISRIEAVEQAQTNNMLTIQQQQMQLASSSELPPRIDAIERAQTAMLKIQENFEQIQRNVSDFDDDLGNHDQRIKALETSSHSPRLLNATRPQKNVTSVASHSADATSSIIQRIDALEKRLSESITEIKESQDVSDAAHGSVLEDFKKNVLKMATRVDELRADLELLEESQGVPSVENLQRSIGDLKSAFAALKSAEATKSTAGDGNGNGLKANIEALQTQQGATSHEQLQLSRRIGALEFDVAKLKAAGALISNNGTENAASAPPTASLQNGTSKQAYDWGPALGDLRKQVADISAKLAESKQFEAGINMGIRSLDTRMNNIYTDTLCKQMVGQLQAVYPNLARAESQLADVKARMGVAEGIQHDHNKSIGYIQEALDAIQGRQQRIDLQMTTFTEGVRKSIAGLQTQADGSKAAGSNEDDAAFRKEMTERIESLSETFKQEIEAASKRLQSQIEGIEHMIEFDEDGKVQSVKEVIHILTENYGTMMGEFDALDYQVQALKTEAASNRGDSASRTDSPLVSRAKLAGNKRSAPPSPSTSSHVSDQQQASKRRRNGLGAFLSDDED